MSKKRRLLLKRQSIFQKRKRSTNRHSSKILLSLPFNISINLQSLDFTSSRRLFESIISPFSERVFFDEYWERKPLIIKRNTINDTNKEYNKLFSFSDLQELIGSGSIRYGQNINVCRYLSGKRENLNGTINNVVSLRELDQLCTKKKATFQLHQPQQYKDILWRLLSMLETYFSCLVGSNVYITPSGSQGLAPHYDDVEVLILQLEGKKHWKLYPPLTHLPESCSNDLNIDDIGEPSHDFIIETGDVLYFPRGTIHHADTPPDVSHSTHITISTYQKHSGGSLLREFLPIILEESIKQEPLLRKGLPLNYLSYPGNTTIVQCNNNSPIMEDMTQLVMKRFNESLLTVKEQYSIDFITCRLPPYYSDRSDIAPKGCTPGLNDIVALCWPDYTYLHSNSNYGNDEWVYVYHSINNDRRTHMVSVSNNGWKPKGLKFPRAFLESLQMIFHNYSSVSVSVLPLSEQDQLSLIMTLWAEGLLSISCD